MAITSQEVVVYSNEVLRPLAEKFRNLKAEVDAAIVEWNNTINAFVPNNSDEILDDGRLSEGVTQITGEDITLLVTQLQAYQSQLNQTGVSNVIEKPCVRPLKTQE